MHINSIHYKSVQCNTNQYSTNLLFNNFNILKPSNEAKGINECSQNITIQYGRNKLNNANQYNTRKSI